MYSIFRFLNKKISKIKKKIVLKAREENGIAVTCGMLYIWVCVQITRAKYQSTSLQSLNFEVAQFSVLTVGNTASGNRRRQVVQTQATIREKVLIVDRDASKAQLLNYLVQHEKISIYIPSFIRS